METPLRKHRKQAGLSIYALAVKACVDPGNLSRIERRELGASPKTAERLAQALGGRISELEILYPERFIRNECTCNPTKQHAGISAQS